MWVCGEKMWLHCIYTGYRLFGTNPSVFGTNPSVFGTNPSVFGTNPSVFGTNPSVFGTNPSIVLITTEIATLTALKCRVFMSGIVDLHLPLSGLGPARMEAWTPDLLGIMEHWVEWLCFLFGYFVWFLMHTSRPSWLSLEWSVSILTVFNSLTLFKFSTSIFSLLFHAFIGCWYKNHTISSVIYHCFTKIT